MLGAVNFLYSIPYKIKDLEFYPNSIFMFVTCGIQHMSTWHYAGGSLTFQAMEIENPKDQGEAAYRNEEIMQREDGLEGDEMA